jgi:hypothetical protein
LFGGARSALVFGIGLLLVSIALCKDNQRHKKASVETRLMSSGYFIKERPRTIVHAEISGGEKPGCKSK